MASTTAAPALLITCDDLLLDELLRLAAAAGCPLDVAHDADAGLRGWAAASVVLVGADLLAGLAAQRPPRREHVHVVCVGPAHDGDFRDAVATGALDVVELPAAEAWLVEVLTDAVDATAGRAQGRGDTIGVVSGSGGAGATTFACALALTSSVGERAVLVDLDPLGPGVDRVVGLDACPGVRWDALVSSPGRLGSRSLREALPDKDGLAVLGWEPGGSTRLDTAVVREVLSAAQRGNDLVVLDLPRAFDDVTAEVVTRCDRVLVVTEPTIPGVASAAKVVAAIRPLNGRVGVVVRRSRSSLPSEQVASALGLPLVAETTRQRRLAEEIDLGLGPVHASRSALARAARAARRTGDEPRAVAS